MFKILFALAIAPVILILWYIYKKDVHKEPAGQLAKSLILGIVIVIPVSIAESILLNMFPTDIESAKSFVLLFINTFVAVGIVEEFFKWLVVRCVNYNNKHFDESYDAIIYCVFASLGFAAFENILYVFNEYLTNGIFASFYIIFLRFLTSVPGHAFFGIYMGYFLSKAKNAQISFDKKLERKYKLLSLFIPTLLHTLYDFLVFTQSGLMILIWFIMLIVLYVFAIKMVNDASVHNKHYNSLELIDNNQK
ncbi:MAG: PrsW family intramembrane metalloprotease [Clostridia bacterium]|nr:PrsW family intramembrane metalloprotease [Clostridia bacterium]